MSRKLFARILFVLVALMSTIVRADEDYLDPEVAFRFSAQMVDPQTIAVTYEIADGYYMYRERFKFAATGATLGTPVYPQGKIKFDDTFQKNVETYRHSVTIRIPVKATGMFTLVSTGQGCADAGLCYAPQEATVRLVGAPAAEEAPAPAKPSAPEEPKAVAAPPAPAAAEVQASVPQALPTAPVDEASKAAQVLSGGRLFIIIPSFLAIGLGLAFTACVYPMLPIISSIIVGEGASVSRGRGLLLSGTYSLGMALVYTALGVVAGLLGEGLAGALQNAWVLGTFGLLMAGMALSMFGLYELQMPAAVQTWLSNVSSRQSRGKLAGVFAMGALSALIVGPCVAAPLAGALTFIGQTRDAVLGGVALFSVAAGMSIPLLIVGVSAGTLLPRAGVWMDQIKRVFGVLMLGVALWLVSPVLPPAVQMIGWVVLLVGYGAYLQRSSKHWAALAVGLVFAALGVMQLVGVASGGRDPLAPLDHLRGGVQQGLHFKRVKSTADLDAVLAQLGGKSAMLDFYADWCVSCKEMEKDTFIDPRVQSKLANTVLLQVDVTANDADDKAMLKRFKLFGPPGIILFDSKGAEIPGARVIGYQAPEKFLASLARLMP